jgi:hypothetical protein
MIGETFPSLFDGVVRDWQTTHQASIHNLNICEGLAVVQVMAFFQQQCIVMTDDPANTIDLAAKPH